MERKLECCERSRAVVEFERTLRQRVADSMSCCAPRTLESKVRAALTAESGQRDGAGDSMPITTETARSSGRWREFFAGPTRANVFAVAACLTLVAGAVLVGIFGRPIDQFQPSQREDAARDAASFASTEHTRCAGSGAKALQERDPALASQSLSHLLDAPVEIPDLSGIGYEFVGAGASHVPGFERSAHLFYRRTRPDGGAMCLSLFVARHDGPFLIREGPTAMELRPGAVHPFPAASTCREGRIWTDGHTIRLLVCCHQADLPKALQLLRPAETAAP